MKRPNIHKYPWEAQEYILYLERKIKKIKKNDEVIILNHAKPEPLECNEQTEKEVCCVTNCKSEAYEFGYCFIHYMEDQCY